MVSGSIPDGPTIKNISLKNEAVIVIKSPANLAGLLILIAYIFSGDLIEAVPCPIRKGA